MQFLRLAEFHNKNTYKTCRDSWSQKHSSNNFPIQRALETWSGSKHFWGTSTKKKHMFFCCRIKGMGILWYVYIYTKKLCPSQIFVHQTCVCCVFFISDLPISSTNTPDNSPLATCDDSKFQDIEKQLRDSDKNPVGCIGWWAAECLNSLGDRVFQPTKWFLGNF